MDPHNPDPYSWQSGLNPGNEPLVLNVTRYELDILADLVNQRIDALANWITSAVLLHDNDRALLLARERNHLIENVRANMNRTLGRDA